MASLAWKSAELVGGGGLFLASYAARSSGVILCKANLAYLAYNSAIMAL